MVNSESMDSSGDGKPKDYVTQLNSGGVISVDTHSPSPVTASSVRLRDMDFDASESAADVTSSNPIMDSLPETAVTRTIDEENFRLTTTTTTTTSSNNNNNAISQTENEVSSLYCSVPLNKVQDVLGSYSVDSADSTDGSGESAKNKKLLTRKLLCLYCDRTFVTSNLRQKHVDRCHSVKQARRSSSRFQTKFTTACIFCKKFNNTDHNLNDLFKHLVEKHSNKYFACVPCEERFVFKTHLDEHNLRNHEQKMAVEGEVQKYNGAISSEDHPTEESSIMGGIKTKHKTKIKKEAEAESEDLVVNRPNLRMSVRKELRKKKVGVKSTKAGVKRNTRLQTKVLNAQNKSPGKKRAKTRNDKGLEPVEKSSSCVNPYPTFDAYFRVKKITDHSIDNLKISSLTFDDVFDKAFYTRIKCNIQENLQNHIDGKLFKNEESESRISNFEKNQEVNSSPTENFGCDISLNAATPVVSLLSSQLGEDFESQIEYGAKASKKKPPPKKDEVHYKYFTRRKYQASILENKENRDLSKLDMWTQLVVKDRQQKIINEKKTEKEKLEYTKGIEYRTKMQNLELNRILDRRGPFEDLKEEANKKAAMDKYNRLGENINCEAISDVTCILNDVIERIFDLEKCPVKMEEDERVVDQKKLQTSDRDTEIPYYLNLRRNSSLIDQPDVDKSDRITLICSSQETENYEESTVPRDKNALVELTGEWTRTRIYICAACGVKVPNMKLLLDHKSIYHQNVWVQHYEFVGNQSVLYRNLSIPGLGKVGYVEEFPMTKLWKRSDARLCTKCSKMCNTLGELHRHMLECGEDWSWMLARKKLKYRPFGTKSRRKRRGLVKRIIHKEKSGNEVREKKKYNIKRYDGPRAKPSDAETIQRMLANLPAKRATRKLISLKDGFPKQVRRKPSQKSKNAATTNAKNTGTLSSAKKKTSVSSLKKSTLKGANVKKKGLKCNSMILRKSVRNINKVFGSKILDSNSTLLVKRKIKTVLQHQQRITRARKVQINEQVDPKSSEAGILNKVKMLTKAVKKTMLKKDEKKSNNKSESSVNANKSSPRIIRNLNKSDSLDDTIKDIINSIDSSDTSGKSGEQSANDENTAKKAISRKKPKVMKKENVSAKLARTLSLRKVRKKKAEEEKRNSQSNLELNAKNTEVKVKNGKRKSTFDCLKSKIKKMKLKDRSVTQIVQVDGSSQISDEILPFLEKIHIDSDETVDKTTFDKSEDPETDPLGDEQPSNIIITQVETEVETTQKSDNKVQHELVDDKLDKETHHHYISEIPQDQNAEIEKSTNILDSIAENTEIHLASEILPPENLDETQNFQEPSSVENKNFEPQDGQPSTPIDAKACNTNKVKAKKRSKGLNDCIAMLTSKLQQRVEVEQQSIPGDIQDQILVEGDCPGVVEKEIFTKTETKTFESSNKEEVKYDKISGYSFGQIPFFHSLIYPRLLEMNHRIISKENFEKERQEAIFLQNRLLVEQQLFLQQFQKQIHVNNPYSYIPNIPREASFLINNIMLGNQKEIVEKNDDNVTKFLNNFDKNKFKEVDVNIEIDIMKCLGNVAENCIKLDKARNRNEIKKKSNKTGTSRKYNNKRKENIEITRLNEQREEDLINKTANERQVENDLNPSFLESDELKLMKKCDIFKDNEKVIDLKVNKKSEDAAQIMSASEKAIKNDIVPVVAEKQVVKAATFILPNVVNEAIDLKIKKAVEKEKKHINLFEELAKNGLSIALFPAVDSNTKKTNLNCGDIVDLKINKIIAGDVLKLPGKEDENENLSFEDILRNCGVFKDNEQAIDLKINKVTDMTGDQNQIKTNIPQVFGDQALSLKIPEIFGEKTSMEGFRIGEKLELNPSFLNTGQLKKLNEVNKPIDLKKKTEKKRKIPKSPKQKSSIIGNEGLKPQMNIFKESNKALSKTGQKGKKMLKAVYEQKATAVEIGHVNFKLQTAEIIDLKVNKKAEKRSMVKLSENLAETHIKIPTISTVNIKAETIKLSTKDKLNKPKSVGMERKKIILKPPQFIATSIEKFPIIENPAVPRVPTIAESLNFNPQGNITLAKNNIQPITNKSFTSLEFKIQSLLLEDREPDIMEEKRVGNLPSFNSISMANTEIVSEETKVGEKNTAPEISTVVSSKSDTDSEDEIPLANLLKEKRDAIIPESPNSEVLTAKAVQLPEPPITEKALQFTEKPIMEKALQFTEKRIMEVLSLVEIPIMEEALPLIEPPLDAIMEKAVPLLESVVKEKALLLEPPLMEKALSFVQPTVMEKPLLLIEPSIMEKHPLLLEPPIMGKPLPLLESPGAGETLPLTEPSVIGKFLPLMEQPIMEKSLLFLEPPISEILLPAEEPPNVNNFFIMEKPNLLEMPMLIAPVIQNNLPSTDPEIAKDVANVDTLPVTIEAKNNNKKIRVRKRTSATEKKEKPKKKPAQTKTPKSKGTPLYDETDGMNKAARKIKISCQIFQKSSKIVVDKNNILNESENDEDEEEEQRQEMAKFSDRPVVENPLPDIIIKEEHSPMPEPVLQIINDIKTELPDVEEVESEPVPPVPVPNQVFFPAIPEPSSSLTAEDLELEIRRKIKLSNLQLKRENTEDVIPNSIDTTIVYNVDSPEMPYEVGAERDDVDNIYGNDSGNDPVYNGQSQILVCNAFEPEVNMMAEILPSTYDGSSLSNQNEIIFADQNPVDYDQEVNPNYNENCEIDKVSESIYCLPHDVELNAISVNDNANTVETDPLDITNESNTLTALTDHLEDNCDVNFDVQNEKERDLSTENNVIPNTTILEEQTPIKDPENKPRKNKKKYEELPTDILPTYGEFQVNSDQTAGVNKITISRKKLQIKTDETLSADGHETTVDIYVVKKPKRNHRKSTNNKEKKRKKSSSSLKENQIDEGVTTGKNDNTMNGEVQSNCLDNFEHHSNTYPDDLLDNIEFEVQNEEIGRKLKINKKKIKDIPQVPQVQVEEVLIPETKPDAENVNINEEPKDYDDLPKDMEIEEFQVDIPIIETQFKQKFEPFISHMIVINNNADTETIVSAKEVKACKRSKKRSKSYSSTFEEFQMEKNETVILPISKTPTFDAVIGKSGSKDTVDAAFNFTEEECAPIRPASETANVYFRRNANNSFFSNMNLYEGNSNQNQNLLGDFSTGKCIPFIETDINIDLTQNETGSNEFDSFITEAIGNDTSISTKKSKKPKNAKNKTDIATMNINFDQFESSKITIDDDKEEAIHSDQLNSCPRNAEVEIFKSNFNANADLPSSREEDPLECFKETRELIVEDTLEHKNFKKSSKRNKTTKNTEFADIMPSNLDVVPSDFKQTETEIFKSPKIDLLYEDSSETKQSSKKNKKLKTVKTSQKSDPSMFDMMCDELQALCDAPLELRPLTGNKTNESFKEIDVDLNSDDLLNSSSNSFCDNVRNSCDAKINELLKEISFGPKHGKKSKRSRSSSAKILEHCDSTESSEKNSLDLDRSKSQDLIDSIPDVDTVDGVPEMANENFKKITPVVTPKPKIPRTKSPRRKSTKTKKERSFSVENVELYCDICDKVFARSENLVKHKRTLTHIAKLSEIEAREAAAKAKLEEAVEQQQQESYKMDINISDILNNTEKHCQLQDLNNEIPNKIHVNSPFVLKTNSDTLKLADIINDVLNKPVENEKHTTYSDSHLSQTPNPIAKGEIKRYKSLGERKSFESDLKTTYPFNTMQVVSSDPIPIAKLPNPDTILKQQISILENIIETEGSFGYIDDITVSDKSIEGQITKSPSEISMVSATKHDDSNPMPFTHNTHIINTLIKPNIHNEPFIKPTQYEEISNDSSSVRNQFDDQRSRKVLNRDEELFLECCSLLKSGSEVSGYSKRSSKTVHVLNNFEMKQSDEPDWMEKKNFATKTQEYRHDIFSSSCPNTPLGDGYGEDYSNTNSNTIATDWSTKQRERQHENPIFEDISIDSKVSTGSKQEMEQFKIAEHTFGDFKMFHAEKEEASKDMSNAIVEPIDSVEDIVDEKEVDEDFKKKMVSRFGGLLAKAWKNSMQVVKKNKIKKRPGTEVTQTSITDYAVPMNATSKTETDMNDSKKMLTKGAMKVFEGLKVSIPTDDLDMKELLNGSHTTKKHEEHKLQPPEIPPKEMEPPKEDLKIPKSNNMKSFGNRLGLKVTKKKHNPIKPKDPSSVAKVVKNDEESKKGHDVYDFEETQDNTDIFTSKLTNIKEFRSQIAEKKTLSSELPENKEPSSVEEHEESDSESRRGYIDSFSFEAQSLSNYSTESSSSLKKPKKKNITKKKCMIMGRIFKNAFKSKIEEDIRDIPSVDNSKLVEDYVMHLPPKEEKRTKLSEQEMDMLFDKLLEDKQLNEEVRKEDESPVVVVTKTVEKSGQPKSKLKNPPKRKRQRHNSDSTDDEFNLNKNRKRYTKKKQKNNDSAINLEQELKECIGVASRKSQRKCTSGKQNVLVEFWSSDDSNFEAFLRETAIDKPQTNDKVTPVEETNTIENVENIHNVEKPETRIEEPFKDLVDTIKKATPKIEMDNQKITLNPVNNKPDRATSAKQCRRKSNAKYRGKDDDDIEDRKLKNIKVTAETLAANRRKRAASNTLYYWSSSSEDESQDLIEIKPVRDEIDEDEDRPMQHGWIVGDSPKKLVTMLAQAKGKKVDADSVKEQGKKRTTL